MVAIIDLDCFYAQVEMVHNPALKDKPIGIRQKNLMVTCNYIARNMGVKKTMSINEAKKFLPSLVIIDGSNIDKYRVASNKVFDFLCTFGTVEKGGMDEFYLDVKDYIDNGLIDESTCHFYGEMSTELQLLSCTVHSIRQQLFDSLGYTTSSGISTSKLFAKLCADIHKPFQQTTFSADYAQSHLLTVPVKHIPGFGHSSRSKFDIEKTIIVKDFIQKYSKSDFISILGSRYDQVYDLMLGIDKSTVFQSSTLVNQISVEDSGHYNDIKRIISKLSIHLLQLVNDKELKQDLKRWPSKLRLSYGTSYKNRKSKTIKWPLSLIDNHNSLKLKDTILLTLLPLLSSDTKFYIVNICATDFNKIENTISFENKTEFFCDQCNLSLPLFAKTAHLNFHNDF